MEPAVLKKEKRAITFFGSLHGDLVPAKIAMQTAAFLICELFGTKSDKLQQPAITSWQTNSNNTSQGPRSRASSSSLPSAAYALAGRPLKCCMKWKMWL
jgi:hypothetical protein